MSSNASSVTIFNGQIFQNGNNKLSTIWVPNIWISAFYKRNLLYLLIQAIQLKRLPLMHGKDLTD